MDLVITKVLAHLAYPLSASLTLIAVAGVLLWFGRRRLGASLLAFALVWLWLWSNPIFTDQVRASLEQRYPPVPIGEHPHAGAIVVLGGGIDPAVPPRLHPDLRGAADRVWHAARLYHAGKAPLIILSGGAALSPEAMMPESEAMAELLGDLGVPQEALLHEPRSRNTYENALFTRDLIEEHGLEQILLVTSALHMPRSVMIFESLGVPLIPASTDIEVAKEARTALDLLPSAGALEPGTRAFKEYLGIFMFRLRGR